MSSFARFNLLQYLIALSHTVCVESLELLILTFLISCFSYMKRICKSFENVEKKIREIIAIRKISWTLVANFCLPLQRLSNLISIHKNYIIISLFMLFFQFILFKSSSMYKIFVVGCGDLVFFYVYTVCFMAIFETQSRLNESSFRLSKSLWLQWLFSFKNIIIS